MILLGFDIGSSSVKATLFKAVVAMENVSLPNGWREINE